VYRGDRIGGRGAYNRWGGTRRESTAVKGSKKKGLYEERDQRRGTYCEECIRRRGRLQGKGNHKGKKSAEYGDYILQEREQERLPFI
jgi:hypothetical protein